MKQGGRRSGRKWGWRKRWFELQPEGNALKYAASAGADAPTKGLIPVAAPCGLFVPRGIEGPPGYPHVFVLTTTVTDRTHHGPRDADGRAKQTIVKRSTQTILLAASGASDLDAWLTALQRCMPKESVVSSPQVLQSQASSL